MDFEHEVVTDNSSADFLTGWQADLHGTDGWWSCVGDGSGRGQHGNVEADGDGEGAHGILVGQNNQQPSGRGCSMKRAA